MSVNSNNNAIAIEHFIKAQSVARGKEKKR
jgi:hypothetical protein